MGLCTACFFPGKGAPLERDQVQLEHSVQVDNVVEVSMADRGLPGLLVDVVVALERLDECMHLIRSNVGDHVHILRLTRQTVQRAGDRAADVVRDAQSIEPPAPRGERPGHIWGKGHPWEIPFSGRELWTP